MHIQKLEVLVVEDNPTDFLLFKETVGQIEDCVIKLHHAETLHSAIEMVAKTQLDIVLLDLFLPDSRGEDTFALFNDSCPELPVVVLSGVTDMQKARDIVKQGAQDFLVKNAFTSELLYKTLLYSIERKSYADEQRRNEIKYRSTFESVAVGIGEYDYTDLYTFVENLPQSTIAKWENGKMTSEESWELRDRLVRTDMNKEMLRMFGASSIGQFVEKLETIIGPRTNEFIFSLALAIRRNTNEFEREVWFNRIDGSEMCTIVRVRLLGSGFGFHRMLMSVSEVTPLKKAQNEVKKQSDVLKTIANSAASLLTSDNVQNVIAKSLEELGENMGADWAGYFTIGEKCHLKVSWNRPARDAECDKSESERMMASVLDMFTPEHCISLTIENAQSFAADFIKKYRVLEYLTAPVFLRKKLVGAIVLKKAIPATPFSGFERSGLLNISRNLSSALERFETQSEVQKLNEQLEHRVLERTDQLEAANKELESFVYSVSHDLRAPLRAVIGFSGVLEEDFGEALDDSGKHFLNNIKNGAQEMSKLIDDLLQFSRMGRAALQIDHINMSKFVQEMASDLKSQAVGQKVQIEFGDILPCRADKTTMRQVISNLIWNAIKYSKTKPETIIKWSSKPIQNGFIEYEISDNGVGFDMKYVDKIFGVFQRLHQDTEFEGTGVGLAIVQRIIKRHGGLVSAHGEVGVGAKFTFTLPSE